MKIVRFERDGRSRYGLIEAGLVYEAKGDIFGEVQKGRTVGPLNDVRLLAPIEPPRVISLGANYRDRCMENKIPIPDVPGRGDTFLVPLRSVVGPDGAIAAPDEEMRVEHGAELAVVMRRAAKDVPVERIKDYVLGFTCVNNVWGKRPKHIVPPSLPRSFDGSCPLGPVIVTDLEPTDLAIRCRVNGELRQNSRTSQMIFDAYTVASHVSHLIALGPGDVIQTGTPGGVTAL